MIEDNCDKIGIVSASWSYLPQTKYTQELANDAEKVMMGVAVLKCLVETELNKDVSRATKEIVDKYKEIKELYEAVKKVAVEIQSPPPKRARRRPSDVDSEAEG